MKYREEKVWVELKNGNITCISPRRNDVTENWNIGMKPCILKIPVEEKKVEVTRSQLWEPFRKHFPDEVPIVMKSAFFNVLCKELGLEEE